MQSNRASPQSLLVHAQFLIRPLRFMVIDSDKATDVVKGVWVAALRRPPRSVEAARSWLWRVSYLFALLHARNRSEYALDCRA